MLKYVVRFGLLVTLALMLQGCASNRATATLSPDTDLTGVKSIYVLKFAPDKRGINNIIADKLGSMGYQVRTGADTAYREDVLVTYKDKRMWDITMYMIELTITLRDPKTEFPLATGNSFHTSLTRKSPQEMVDEVIGNIFKQER